MECKELGYTEEEVFQMRFNRDIVECKVMKCKRGTIWKDDLIETLWNVKSSSSSIGSSINADLIETLWNVKTFRPRKKFHLRGRI